MFYCSVLLCKHLQINCLASFCPFPQKSPPSKTSDFSDFSVFSMTPRPSLSMPDQPLINRLSQVYPRQRLRN